MLVAVMNLMIICAIKYTVNRLVVIAVQLATSD
jgi:hypothetical protein